MMTSIARGLMSIIYLLLAVTAIGQIDDIGQEILQIFETQEDAWNAGDIPAFMETYWKSEDLTFLGASGPVYGWQATLERYYKRYPDRQTMGVLKFDIERIDKRSKDVYSVVGHYHLTREGIDDLAGYFLILVQHINGRWLIVADSTH